MSKYPSTQTHHKKEGNALNESHSEPQDNSIEQTRNPSESLRKATRALTHVLRTVTALFVLLTAVTAFSDR